MTLLPDSLKRIMLKPVLRAARRLNSGEHDYRALRLGVARFDRLLSTDRTCFPP
jgi:hypothetical protein